VLLAHNAWLNGLLTVATRGGSITWLQQNCKHSFEFFNHITITERKKSQLPL